ncbi:hypothetical protein [Changpingibacter yushuensis]|uniref:hypothetical protein n=1 Tax=Changpingibacter yushuensis TaxID=2758440 RepID=UPI00165DA17B|nr:hypothetical protein [Changpingibacter yushuensis]
MRFTDSFVRLRAGSKVDPYSEEPMVADWSNPDRKDLLGFFDSQASSENDDPVRRQTVDSVTLYCETKADLRRGDRVEWDDDGLWTVVAFTFAPKNPFTGWQPYKAATLERTVG